MARWIDDGEGVQPGGDVGGDVQVTEAFSRRFLLADDDGVVRGRAHTDHGDPRHGSLGANATETLYSQVTMIWYGVARLTEDSELDLDSDGEPVIWIQEQVETMVCTDLEDPGGTERKCEYEYHDHDRFFPNYELAEDGARTMATNYTAELANRDMVWDGLANWERDGYGQEIEA